MTIAAKHFDPQLGIDIHTYLIPPSPIPIPLPTPHIGIVLDPFDYIPVIGGTINVNGVKRATAGCMGLDLHIPVGGAWMPTLKMPMGPQWDDEIFMGSRTVLADGDPFSRVAMPVLACNIVGMVAPFRARKPKRPKLSLLLPTTVNLAIPTNVYVGGAPTVSWTALAMGAGLAGLGKLLKKTGVAGRAAAAFKGLRQRMFANLPPGFLKCKVLRAEPVDIRDGSVSVTHEDFAIPGRLPLSWVRQYRSGNDRAGVCGHGWQTPADLRLELYPDGSALFVDVESAALFPQLPAGEGSEHAVRELVDGARLSCEDGWLWVRTKDGLRYGFEDGNAHVVALQGRSLAIGRIEDLCGNHWRFERQDGHLVRIVESGTVDADTGQPLQGRFIEVDSRHGRIERMQLHDPATGLTHPLVRYGYDGEGDLTAAIDPLEAARTFEYVQHRMVRHTDRVGLSFYYAYNAQWQVVHSWGDGGLYDYRFRYDDLLIETEITDSLGHVSIVKFDENRLPLCEIDPLDGVTVFEYDEVGRTTAVVDPLGLRTQFDYDERGNLLKLTRPDGSAMQSAYDDDDRPISVVDPLATQWKQQWDERGLLVAQSAPLGAASRYEYDIAGLLVAHTDPLGAVTRLYFDRHGQLQRLTDPLGFTSTFRHDALGRLLEQSDAAGQRTRYSYDAKGRLLNAVQPGGTTVRAEYDAEDQLLKYTDESGHVTRLEYVGVGQIARRIQPDGHAVRYQYDTEERLVAVVNQRGETYRLKRDPLGCIIEEVDYWGQSRHYRYDAASRLAGTTDPLGQTIVYATDKLGRITQKVLPDPDRAGQAFKETFKYDPSGQLVELRNPHRHVQRKFDAEGRLLEETQDGFRIASHYDAVGQRILRETSAGNRVACDFDLRGQLASATINDEAPIAIERDALGRAVTERLSPQVQRQLRYDDRGLLTAQAMLKDEAPLFDTGYAYDRSGNLTERHDSGQGRDAYSYDPMGRILSHTDPRGKLTHFLNDPAGDRLRTRVHEARMQQAVGGEMFPDQWTREGSFEGLHYVFDRAGNLIRRGEERMYARPEDEARDLHLRWDANHRLIESTKNGQATRYGYDPLGRRVFKRNPTHTTWFFWDGDALLGEVTHANDAANAPSQQGAANVVDFLAAKQRKAAFEELHKRAREYVYYPGSFVPLALIDKQPANEYRFATERAGARVAKPSSSLPAPTREPQPDSRPLHGGGPRWGENEAASRDPSAHAMGFGGLGDLALGQPPAILTAPVPTAEPAPAMLGGLGGMALGSAKGASTAPTPPASMAPRAALIETIAEDSAERTAEDVTASAEPTPDARVPRTSHVFHYHVDPNGCPTRITDAVGTTAWSASYTVWGAAQKRVEHIDNSLRFQGQYFDEESGLSYNRYRYYDPVNGQYVSRDPLGLIADTNFYDYAPNAFAWADPLGLDRMPSWMPTRTLYQRQHLIPHSLRNHPIFVRSRMDINSASNMMYLPMFPGVDSNPMKGLHRGWTLEHQAYNEMIGIYLDDLDDMARREGWDYRRTQVEITGLQRELRAGLQDGRFTCAT